MPTLYTFPGNFRAFKALIPAQYNNVAIDVPDFKMLEDNKKPEFLKKNPLGKVPVLETKDGCLFESNAIARYIARSRRDTKLFGSTFYQSVCVILTLCLASRTHDFFPPQGEVNSWIEFCAHELELPATMWCVLSSLQSTVHCLTAVLSLFTGSTPCLDTCLSTPMLSRRRRQT
jgi:elongation factor 1-gamma